FSSRRRHTRFSRDWSSDVCSSDLQRGYNKLKDQPGFSACFAPEGRAPRVGEIFRNPAQANSLELIAKTNGDAFYRGELAQKIARSEERRVGKERRSPAATSRHDRS